MSLEFFNILVGIGTLLILFFLIATIVVAIVFGRKSSIIASIIKHALPLGIMLGFISVSGSLMYSEVYNLPPCLFCWWQRVLIYPQLLLFTIAWYRSQHHQTSSIEIFWYTTPLAMIGSLVSIWHIFLQRGVIKSTGACALDAISCTAIDIQIFGFITIPIMALVVGVALILLGVLVLTTKKPL